MVIEGLPPLAAPAGVEKTVKTPPTRAMAAMIADANRMKGRVREALMSHCVSIANGYR